MLVILAGLIGVGKTEIAKRLEDIGYIRLDRDAYRSFFFNPIDFKDFEQREAAYHAMLPIAYYYLQKGENVVFDGLLFNHKDQIDRAINLAKEANSPVKLIHLVVSDKIAIERLQSQKDHVAATSRTPGEFKRVKKSFENIKIPHKTINTKGSIEDVFKECLLYINSSNDTGSNEPTRT